MSEYKYIGKSELRKDAYEKVTGAATYTADVHCKGMLYGKILTSTVAHARIKSVDTSEAEKLPGVVAVVTGKDAEKYPRMGVIADRSILCRDKIRYYGDYIAAVAAVSKEIAREAVKLIKVEYDELPAVFDPLEAFDSNCEAIIHENLAEYPVEEGVTYTYDSEHPNQFQHRTIKRGNLEEGFAQADVIVEETYKLPEVTQGYLEPNAALVIPDPDGGITLYASEQDGYLKIADICATFGFTFPQVRFHIPYLGGGFGGKDATTIVPVTILLALKANRPVRIEHTREECFVSGNPRPAAYVRIKDGYSKDGTLTARKIKVILDGGAYTTASTEVASNGIYGAIGSYRQHNLEVESYGVYTNTGGNGAYRSLGSEICCFAIESNMTLAAEKLGIDSVEIRLKNLLKDGEADGAGQPSVDNDCIPALKEAARRFNWYESVRENEGPWVYGKGVAVGNKIGFVGDMGTSATCKIKEDGTLEIYVFHVEMGQGALTVDAQSAAEVFKMPVSKVKMKFGDSTTCPHDFGTFYSKGTFVNGRAIILACEKAKEKLLNFVAWKYDCDKEQLFTEDSVVYSKTDKNFKVHISELFHETGWIECGDLAETATYVSTFVPYDESGQSTDYAAFYSHGVWCVEVAVHRETGEIRIQRAVGVYDCGKVINYSAAMGQLEGSFSMGLAQAVYEESIRDKTGKIVNANFRDYRIPTFMDSIKKENLYCGFIDGNHHDGPWGAKGMGEVAMIPVMPAVAAAVHDALGIKMNRLPVSFERVCEAVKESKSF
ncbi:MAG: xanthine dehydrogenase family protein molybdopterin-binding subunit [Bacillota bacterium]|nr:xanthine dehydrogenase family protein molybdopterin-binding subunit [Bacillota bacterium]